MSGGSQVVCVIMLFSVSLVMRACSSPTKHVKYIPAAGHHSW